MLAAFASLVLCRLFAIPYLKVFSALTNVLPGVIAVIIGFSLSALSIIVASSSSATEKKTEAKIGEKQISIKQ